MKRQLLFAPLWLLLLLLLPGIASHAQGTRNKNSSAVPYRNSYQRMATSCHSNSSFELRNGTLWASGDNTDGQLGDGTTTARATPVQITGTTWINVASAAKHTLALKSNGTLWAWGNNSLGALGDGTTTSSATPVQITGTTWVSIACGVNHSLALKSDGSLWAWGNNGFGQLGDGSNTSSSSPVQITGTWSSIASGNYHSLALKSNGKLYAWGDNSVGQCGDGTTTTSNSPVQITGTTWTSISAGSFHSLGIMSDGTLWSWGFNGLSELGDGTTTDRSAPVQIAGTTWTMVSAGSYQSLAIKSDGTLWAWGNNAGGRLGDGTTTARASPVQIAGTTWVSVASGSGHTLGLKSDGTYWSWGGNANGQLGDGTTTGIVSPARTQSAVKQWLSVSGGNAHTAMLKGDGTIWTAGYDGFGQLGDGDNNILKMVPAQITGNSWIGLACGAYTVLALKSNGTLWAFGANWNGQLGDGFNSDQSTPVQVAGTDWVSIASGETHSLGLKSDGTLWAWGSNGNGELGDGTNTDQFAPVQISGTTWVSIACGGNHSLALKSDGTLWAWGYNGQGELGDGTNTSSNAPVQIAGTSWVRVTAGESHSLALQADGTLWAWGDNGSGQLGDNSNTSSTSPVQITGDWLNIASGAAHNQGLKSDGSLYAWGYNGDGELGDASTSTRIAPTAISSQADVVTLMGNTSTSSASAMIKASRSQLCLTGRNHLGQLADGTTTDAQSYNCTNNICADYSLATGALSYTQPVSGSGNRTDFQGSCSLAASLTPSGASPAAGSVTSKVWIESGVPTYNTAPYVARHYQVTPASNASTATGTVILYFTQAEFTAYNGASNHGPDMPVDATDALNNKSNLRITQKAGISNDASGLPGTYTNGAIVVIPTSVVWDADNSRWVVSLDVTGFSGFFLSTSLTPLPVKLISFTAINAGRSNRLDWQTATEGTESRYNVERSSNGGSFTGMGIVAGKGSNSAYTFFDQSPLADINYYRLRISDASGEDVFSNIAIVKSDGHTGGITVAPVPATNSVTITNTDISLIGSSVTITDMTGREMYRFSLSATQNTIDVQGWAAGIYNLRLPGGTVVKIVKQ